MSSPMETIGRWELATQQFIDYARSAVPTDQAFGPWHIILAALSDISPERRFVNPFISLIDDHRRDQCATALRAFILLQGEKATTTGAVSQRLADQLITWEQAAIKRNVHVTTSFIFWYLITNDVTLQTIFEAGGIDHVALLNSLVNRFEPLFTEVRESIPIADTNLTAYQEVREYTELVKPSNQQPSNLSGKLLFAGMHAVLLSNIFNVVGTLEPSKIAVLAGPNGTPIYQFDQVLADILEAREYSVEDRPRLVTRHEHVYRVDLGALRNLALIPDKPAPYQVLRMIMQEAEKQHAMLVVRGLETLTPMTETDKTLKGVLSEPGGCLIIGVYETPIIPDITPSQGLMMNNIVEIAARPESPLQTRTILAEFYMPQWHDRYGYQFTPDAFDSVIALEPGAWINQRRKTLPYLVVGLALDTIQTARGGKHLILDTARMAIDALDQLQEEWATTEKTTRVKFESVLEQASADIIGLLHNPQPARDQQGYYVLTRGHVVAQLICPNDSEFHYPGHGPQALVSRSIEDLPRHLAGRI